MFSHKIADITYVTYKKYVDLTYKLTYNSNVIKKGA